MAQIAQNHSPWIADKLPCSFAARRACYSWGFAECIIIWSCLIWLGVFQICFCVASRIGVVGYFLTLHCDFHVLDKSCPQHPADLQVGPQAINSFGVASGSAINLRMWEPNNILRHVVANSPDSLLRRECPASIGNTQNMQGSCVPQRKCLFFMPFLLKRPVVSKQVVRILPKVHMCLGRFRRSTPWEHIPLKEGKPCTAVCSRSALVLPVSRPNWSREYFHLKKFIEGWKSLVDIIGLKFASQLQICYFFLPTRRKVMMFVSWERLLANYLLNPRRIGCFGWQTTTLLSAGNHIAGPNLNPSGTICHFLNPRTWIVSFFVWFRMRSLWTQ